MKRAVFPGSFDPFTNGHFDIVNRALSLFDEIIIAIGENSSKQPLFEIEKRVKYVESAFTGNPKVKVERFSGLTVGFCRSKNVHFILRGVRNTVDFEYERSIAEMNHRLYPEIDTVILFTSSETAAISSTILREIHKNKGDISPFVPYIL